VTRDQLEHAIRAVCDLTGDDEVYVFGSQAILGMYPDSPDALLVSEEVDMTPKHRPQLSDLVDGALGQDSAFHHAHGFYVHGVSIHEAAVLPEGWEQRAGLVRNANTRNNAGWCIEAHDLAASKLYAFRDKDREFVRVLLQHGMIGKSTLEERVGALFADPNRVTTIRIWLRAI
jgi:hypothetical protein